MEAEGLSPIWLADKTGRVVAHLWRSWTRVIPRSLLRSRAVE